MLNQLFRNVNDIWIWIRWIPRCVYRIIKWFPVIWNDRQWDSHYFFIIMRHKLKIMEKSFHGNHGYIGALADAARMKVCIKILDRLIADEYELTSLKDHDAKWGEIEMNTNPCKNNLCKLVLTRKNVETKEDEILERKEFLNCCKKAETTEKEDLAQLFGILQNNIRLWWD